MKQLNKNNCKKSKGLRRQAQAFTTKAAAIRTIENQAPYGILAVTPLYVPSNLKRIG